MWFTSVPTLNANTREFYGGELPTTVTRDLAWLTFRLAVAHTGRRRRQKSSSQDAVEPTAILRPAPAITIAFMPKVTPASRSSRR